MQKMCVQALAGDSCRSQIAQDWLLSNAPQKVDKTVEQSKLTGEKMESFAPKVFSGEHFSSSIIENMHRLPPSC
jgi:hypothetical protein